MNRAAGINNQKTTLKLVLCLIGIILAIAILIAMKPLPGNKNSEVTAAKPADAKNLSNSGISAVGQAAPVVQTVTSTGLTNASSPQTSQANYSASNSSSPVSVPPAQPIGVQTTNPDAILYPIDPIPCKRIDLNQVGCGACEPYPGPAGQIGSCPRCYGGGIEMMCAYPL
jgi:hypothetical protein